MVDVHDRRPVVFTATDAALWLDPATPPEMVEQLARNASLGPEWFDWFKVSKAVGSFIQRGPGTGPAYRRIASLQPCTTHQLFDSNPQCSCDLCDHQQRND